MNRIERLIVAEQVEASSRGALGGNPMIYRGDSALTQVAQHSQLLALSLNQMNLAMMRRR